MHSNIHISRAMRAAAALALILASAATASATIIDTFTNTENNDADAVNAGGVGSDSVNFIITPSVTDPIGSRRRLDVVQNAQNQNAANTVDGVSGEAAFTSTAGAASEWNILYGVGLIFLHFDGTQGGADAFRLTFTSHTANLEYVIVAFGGITGGTSNNGTYQPLAGNVIDVPYASFSNSANIDFSDIYDLEIRVRDAGLFAGGQARLTQFETVALSAPEPASIVLLSCAAGILGCGAVLRRRRDK